MISFGIFVGLLFCLHGCFASPAVCEVVLATKMIELQTKSILCDGDAPQHASLCDSESTRIGMPAKSMLCDDYTPQYVSLCDLESTLITCNGHGEIQSIDLSGFGIYGATMHGIEHIYLCV